jgi:hypothetical protein
VVTQVLQDVVVFTEPNEQINGVAGVARCDAHFLHEVPRAAVSSVIDASFSGPPQRSAVQRSAVQCSAVQQCRIGALAFAQRIVRRCETFANKQCD